MDLEDGLPSIHALWGEVLALSFYEVIIIHFECARERKRKGKERERGTEAGGIFEYNAVWLRDDWKKKLSPKFNPSQFFHSFQDFEKDLLSVFGAAWRRGPWRKRGEEGEEEEEDEEQEEEEEKEESEKEKKKKVKNNSMEKKEKGGAFLAMRKNECQIPWKIHGKNVKKNPWK